MDLCHSRRDHPPDSCHDDSSFSLSGFFGPNERWTSWEWFLEYWDSMPESEVRMMPAPRWTRRLPRPLISLIASGRIVVMLPASLAQIGCVRLGVFADFYSNGTCVGTCRNASFLQSKTDLIGCEIFRKRWMATIRYLYLHRRNPSSPRSANFWHSLMRYPPTSYIVIFVHILVAFAEYWIHATLYRNCSFSNQTSIQNQKYTYISKFMPPERKR